MTLWFPINFKIFDNIEYKKPKYFEELWQIFESSENNVLVLKDKLMSKYLDMNLLVDGQCEQFEFNDEKFYLIISDKSYILHPIRKNLSDFSFNDALSFSASLRKTRKSLSNKISLIDGIFIEKYSIVLPTFTLSEKKDDDVVLGLWLTGGVPISASSKRRLSQLTGFSEDQLQKIVEPLKVFDSSSQKEEFTKNNPIKDSLVENSIQSDKFSLPGRPELENFFNEHIVDIIQNRERYKALGINSPSAIILHGSPGCGKTYAVEQLIDYLDWPSYRVEASSVASPYIHDTSKKIAEVFENAMENAPSVLVIDEMEAFLSDRDNSSGQHSIEEMAEFLRRIPEAIENEVLLIAMTNKINMIDPAILRRGRFDHIIKVDYASDEEVNMMLTDSFEKIATESDLDIKSFAQSLAGRPLSDVSFFIKEGARLAAKSGKNRLNNESLYLALDLVGNRDIEKKDSRMGFVA